jgi:hypothetical protein
VWKVVVVEEKIRISRTAHIILDFEDSLPKETISAVTVIVIVITSALMQKNFIIKKVSIEAIDAEHMKVTFFGEPGSFTRDYVFETAMLVKAVQKASHDNQGDTLQDQLIKEFEHTYKHKN